ncbi:MAG: class I SAM-dependent methyltransferase [Bryobacteraceae bacterium]|jgi:SAM-dependent methyltransferase
MSETLFDLSEQYEEMLRMGVSLSGEDPSYFMGARVDDLRRNLPRAWNPSRILDFGCGTGETAAHLAKTFPGSTVVGVDTSENALELAKQRHGTPGIRFTVLESLEDEAPFDLCYVNGVFHHIEPPERPAAVRAIFKSLAPGGHFALFENNPWNPGTRMVMRRIPFDRDAVTLSHLETRTLLRQGGFKISGSTRFLFYFPRFIRFMRIIEPALTGLPLGAQYYVTGVKP